MAASPSSNFQRRIDEAAQRDIARRTAFPKLATEGVTKDSLRMALSAEGAKVKEIFRLIFDWDRRQIFPERGASNALLEITSEPGLGGLKCGAEIARVLTFLARAPDYQGKIDPVYQGILLLNLQNLSPDEKVFVSMMHGRGAVLPTSLRCFTGLGDLAARRLARVGGNILAAENIECFSNLSAATLFSIFRWSPEYAAHIDPVYAEKMAMAAKYVLRTPGSFPAAATPAVHEFLLALSKFPPQIFLNYVTQAKSSKELASRVRELAIHQGHVVAANQAVFGMNFTRAGSADSKPTRGAASMPISEIELTKEEQDSVFAELLENVCLAGTRIRGYTDRDLAELLIKKSLVERLASCLDKYAGLEFKHAEALIKAGYEKSVRNHLGSFIETHHNEIEACLDRKGGSSRQTAIEIRTERQPKISPPRRILESSVYQSLKKAGSLDSSVAMALIKGGEAQAVAWSIETFGTPGTRLVMALLDADCVDILLENLPLIPSHLHSGIAHRLIATNRCDVLISRIDEFDSLHTHTAQALIRYGYIEFVNSRRDKFGMPVLLDEERLNREFLRKSL